MHSVISVLLWVVPGIATCLAIGSHVKSCADGDTLSISAWRMSTAGGLLSFTTICMAWVSTGYDYGVLGTVVWDVIKTSLHQACFTYRAVVNNKRAASRKA